MTDIDPYIAEQMRTAGIILVVWISLAVVARWHIRKAIDTNLKCWIVALVMAGWL